MRDLGDFQTPPALVSAVLEALGPIGERWPRVLEPTCGRGHFLAGLLALDPPPREVQGIELQPCHLEAARAAMAGAGGSARVGLTEANLFDLDLRSAPAWSTRGPLLVVGNPPWVTSSTLGTLGSGNLPRKHNLHRARGIDAITGSSNFDLAEAIWIKLLTELAHERPTIALLCKHSVARRVLEYAWREGLPVDSASITRLDARAWFGASVEACLLRISLGEPSGVGEVRAWDIPVHATLDAREPRHRGGFVGARLVDDLDAHRRVAFADGACLLVWRQGLKHDAARVMELTHEGDGPSRRYRNGFGERVDVEDARVFPLLRASHLARSEDPRPERAVILTQDKAGDDTRHLQAFAPRLWAYLHAHASMLEARRSSIYRGAPPFAMFGVGPYAFAPYKVAVSALHRKPVFRAIGPREGRPVMFDDTCYFVPARSAEQAALVTTLLETPEAAALIAALGFAGSKRAVTKALLQRVDLRALLQRADRATLLARASAHVERLAGRAADWPDPLESLLEPDLEPTRALPASMGGPPR